MVATDQAQPPLTTLVLVTGANQGIGFEISKKLVTEQDGYHVIMTGRRKTAVDAAAEELRKQGLSVEPLELDVTSDASIGAAARAVEQKYGRLDVLINNAATPGSGGSGGDSESGRDRAAWLEVLDTNVVGVVAVIEAFLPLLRTSRAPTKRIVCLSSGLGSMTLRTGSGSGSGSGSGGSSSSGSGSGSGIDARYRSLKGYRAYSASKAALNMAVYQYAVDFERDPSWKINLCCPGSCSTSLNNFGGVYGPEHGAIEACRLATLVGLDDETGTFSDVDGPVPW